MCTDSYLCVKKKLVLLGANRHLQYVKKFDLGLLDEPNSWEVCFQFLYSSSLCLFPVSSSLSLSLSLSLSWFLIREETMSGRSVGNWTAECFLGSVVLVSHPSGTFFPNSIKELVISEGGPDGPNYTNLSVGAGKKSLLSGSSLLLLSGRYELSVGNLCLWKLCSQAVHVTAQFCFTPVVIGPVAAFLLWGEHWQLILNFLRIASL